MATIQEAMSNSQELLQRAANAQIAPQTFQDEVTRLLSSNLSARGFMAALATGSLPRDDKMQAALLAALKAGQENAYDLIIKNIIMSGCSAQEHERKGNNEAARGSRTACSASVELACLLNDEPLQSLAKEALIAIAQWKKTEMDAPQSTGNGASEKWFAFFERWGYNQQLLAAVQDPLLIVAGGK